MNRRTSVRLFTKVVYVSSPRNASVQFAGGNDFPPPLPSQRFVLPIPASHAAVPDRLRLTVQKQSSRHSKPRLSAVRKAARRSSSRNIQLGKWELLQTAGVGAHSEVFIARPANAADGTVGDYALKRLSKRRSKDRQAIEMFRREATCGAAVSHPNLASTLVTHVDQAPYFFVMPRLKGATARQVLDSRETFTVPKAIWVIRQVAEGLQSLHRAGWIHGDIKPGNIMLGFNGHATLFDFGFARSIGSASPATSKQPDRDPFCGTLRYTAPELLTSTRRLSPASDVYALGVTVYEMLTGEPPFTCSRAGSLAESHLRVPAPSIRTTLPNVPRCVSQVVAAMLAKDPLRRPSSLTELPEMLARLEIETFAMRT